MSATPKPATAGTASEVEIPVGHCWVTGNLVVPAGASGIVLFAHGSGSSRHSPRNQFVARMLHEAKVGTLLFNLLTAFEEFVEARTGHLRFDIGLLAHRLIAATNWLRTDERTEGMPLGYFGASTGGGAALVAAAEIDVPIKAVVSRGGRPDLAGSCLPLVKAPTLLIVGALDDPVVAMNREAFCQLRCEKSLQIVPGATHLFEEPGTLETVGHLAADWFAKHFSPHE
ncbi:MAG TPA: dienelactone hydrolase family protein [Pyrinomonadaceae bacterium]|nr:dienelactone hydrolase family protein [Pyrinomonadaceae bacterium]